MPSWPVVRPNLDERLEDKVSRPLLEGGQWTHVILQAQKYSTSGLYTYSTAGAKSWIALAKARGITPVLYPEHPQAGDLSEGMRVFRLHQQIASEQAACVAPIGASMGSGATTMARYHLT